MVDKLKKTPIIEIRKVFYAKNGISILENINLKIYENDFVVMIGPNGGGKTTLVKLILGLVNPSSGQIFFFGMFSRKNYRNISYVPQEINISKNFPISVMDAVLMGIKRSKKICGFISSKDRFDALEALEKLEIVKYKDRRTGELSGGQQQRVLIARALISKPKLLFMDEPTANIDAKGQTNFYNLLKRLNKYVTVVVISHDLMVLSSYAKSVVCVNRSVYFHDFGEITNKMIIQTYGHGCPIELMAHEVPHRVLCTHRE